MTISFVFWFVMLCVLLFGIWRNWPLGGSTEPAGGLLMFIAVALLGWRVFGFPIQG